MSGPKGTGVLTEGNRPLGDIVWVLSPRDLERLEAMIWTSAEVVIDLETTGLDENAVTGGTSNGGVGARIVLASLTLPQEGVDYGDGSNPDLQPPTWVLPLSHPDSPFCGQWRDVVRRLVRWLVLARKPIGNQNVKFDARWLKAISKDPDGIEHLIVWDTQVSSHLLDETTSTSLKDRAPATFGIQRWDDYDLSTPGAAERVPLFSLGAYAARDTYWTWRLERRHRREMFLEGEEVLAGPQTTEEEINARLGKISVWVAMPTVASLTRLEQRGFPLDVEWVRREIAEDAAVVEEGLNWLSQRYEMIREFASIAATSNWFREMTDRAVKAGHLRIVSVTPSGNAQWTKGNLTRLTRTGDPVGTAQKILDVRRSVKRLEYMRSWLFRVTPEGLVHATYWPGRVVTGRLSCSDPNMQQVNKYLKPAFVPRVGNVIIDLDYSQIELRIAAHVAQCQPMLEAFRRGDDLHRLFASVLNHKHPDAVTPEERQRAKAGNFGLLYEMSAEGFRLYAEDSYGVVLTSQEAAEMHAAYFELWTGLREWHDRVKRGLHQRGYVVSPLGRLRRLPGVWDQNPGMVGFAERAGINAPVQSMASDLMMMAAASIQGLLPGSTAVPGAHLLGTVHDNIVVEAPADRWQEVRDACIERMLEMDQVLARMGVRLTVPLAAEATVGTRWGLNDVQEEEKAAQAARVKQTEDEREHAQ